MLRLLVSGNMKSGIKMYRIEVINTMTGAIFREYGFSKHMMKRIYYFLNEKDNNFYLIYEIKDLTKIVFTFNTFKKCLTHCIQYKGGNTWYDS